MIECRALTKTYQSGAGEQPVLRNLSIRFDRGSSYVLLGPSGSGKTTLLSIMGCLLSPTSGELWIQDERVPYQCKDRLAELRRTRVGFVFQHAQLLPFLSVE